MNRETQIPYRTPHAPVTPSKQGPSRSSSLVSQDHKKVYLITLVSLLRYTAFPKQNPSVSVKIPVVTIFGGVSKVPSRFDDFVIWEL